NVIFGPKTNLLWGEPYIYDSIGELRFAISARSFYQVNPPQTKKLYEKALQYANIDHNDIVIDAYCGIGTISLFMAQQAKKVYGIEVVPEAVNDAKKNAKRNNVTNTEFFVGKAEKVMTWWKAESIKTNVIVVDSPRKGCENILLLAIIDVQPERFIYTTYYLSTTVRSLLHLESIFYIASIPSTLAFYFRILENCGFMTKEIQPVDMFPQTMHVDVVALMSRVDE